MPPPACPPRARRRLLKAQGRPAAGGGGLRQPPARAWPPPPLIAPPESCPRDVVAAPGGALGLCRAEVSVPGGAGRPRRQQSLGARGAGWAAAVPRRPQAPGQVRDPQAQLPGAKGTSPLTRQGGIFLKGPGPHGLRNYRAAQPRRPGPQSFQQRVWQDSTLSYSKRLPFFAVYCPPRAAPAPAMLTHSPQTWTLFGQAAPLLHGVR